MGDTPEAQLLRDLGALLTGKPEVLEIGVPPTLVVVVSDIEDANLGADPDPRFGSQYATLNRSRAFGTAIAERACCIVVDLYAQTERA